MRAQRSFSVSADIAQRTRLTEVRYRTASGRYILTDKDLARLELEPEEYMHGIDVIYLTEEEAEREIEEGGFNVGGTVVALSENEESDAEETLTEPVAEAVTEEPAAEEEPATEEETTDETPATGEEEPKEEEE